MTRIPFNRRRAILVIVILVAALFSWRYFATRANPQWVGEWCEVEADSTGVRYSLKLSADKSFGYWVYLNHTTDSGKLLTPRQRITASDDVTITLQHRWELNGDTLTLTTQERTAPKSHIARAREYVSTELLRQKSSGKYRVSSTRQVYRVIQWKPEKMTLERVSGHSIFPSPVHLVRVEE